MFIKKYETMTLSEFLHQDKLKELEKAAGRIRRNKRLEKITVVLLAVILSTEEVLAADGLDKLGYNFLFQIRRVGYWACIVMGLFEVIKAAVEGDTKSILGILTKYALIYATLYFFPLMLDAIRAAFA